MKRREFIKSSAVVATGISMANAAPVARSPHEKVTIAMVGVNGRGSTVLAAFARRQDVNVKYVCDIDQNVLEQRTGELAKNFGKRAQMIRDFRQPLNDPEVDALVLKREF